MTPIILSKYFAVIFSLVLLLIISNGKRAIISKKSFLPLCGFLVILMHSFFFSTNVSESVERNIFSLLFISAFTIGVALAHNHCVRYAKYAIYTIGIAGITSGLYAMIFIPSSYDGENFNGITSNSNYFALFLSVFFFPVLLENIQNIKLRGIIKVFNIFLLMLLIFIVIETRSRAAMLTIFAIFLFYIYSKERLKKVTIIFNKRIILSLTLLVLFIFNSGYMTNKYSDSSDFTIEETFSTRAIMYQYRIQGIIERPYLGWGYTINSHEGRMIEPWVFNLAEKGTTPLAVIEELGIFLGMIVLGFFWWLFFYGIKKIAKQPAIYLIVLGGLVNGLFETWLFNFNSFFCWFFWLFVIISLNKNSDNLETDAAIVAKK